jgi:hypothetical protein
VSDDPLDELPPEMAAAWREREAEPAPEHQTAAVAEDVEAVAPPVDEPAAAPAPAPQRRRSPLVAFAVLPVIGGAVYGAKVLGIGGWRAGGPLVTALLVGVAVAAGVVLTRDQPLRLAYVGGALALALVGAAWCVSTAPYSHGRLEEVLDRVPKGALGTPQTRRSGHGWCEPRCPTVTRTYVLPARQPEGAMRLAVVALQTAEMIPLDAGRVALSRALGYASAGQAVSIDNQRYTTVVRVEADPSIAPAGGSRITLEVTARRGLKEKPLTPVRAR